MTYKIAFSTMALDGKLPQGDNRWERLNTSFVNQKMEQIDICNAIYTGHPFAAWHNGRRCTENFVCGQFIAVDLETHDERSSLAYLRQMEFIRIYAGILYTTPSHTEADPRSRVLFLLDRPIDNAEAYKAAIEFVYGLIPGSDPNAIKASGFFYGSKGCELDWPNNVLPVSHLRRFYAQWGHTIAPKPKPAERPVVQPAKPYEPTQDKEQEVAEALRKLDPWAMDYQRWISVLAALHDTFGDSALPLAVQWAKGQPGEVERKWKTFGRYSGRRATLATVFGMANGKVH